MKKVSFIFIFGTLLLTCNVVFSNNMTQKDSTRIGKDTSHVMTDTLEEVEVRGKGLTVVNAINKSLKSGLTQPRQKSISDIIGSKATDYIMHPFAWQDRKKEKKKKKTQESILKLEAAQSYEDELMEAINRQLREDSIANAKKKQGMSK